MNNFVFHNPTQLIFGKGQVEVVGKKIASLGKRILLVYGGQSIKKSGLYGQVSHLLKEEGLEVWELGGIEPNPRLTSVYKGIELCKSEGIEAVLAVGGGSVIDAAKAIIMGARYDGDVWDFYTGKAKAQDALPLGTILTLAATGTEMNGNTVVTNWETQRKYGAHSPLCYPKFSILDPVLTYTVPKDQTVNGVMDTLSHVFEQYFSPTPDTPLQDRLCEAVITTVVENAPIALREPENYEARANLMISSTFALNKMVSFGRVEDWASHGIEHELSAIYDIPHGGGLAIITPAWMEYVLEDGLQKLLQLATRVWGVDTAGKSDAEVAREGIARFKDFLAKIGAPSKLGDYNIDPKDIPEMAKKAVERGPLGGIKKLNEEDVRAILESCV